MPTCGTDTILLNTCNPVISFRLIIDRLAAINCFQTNKIYLTPFLFSEHRNVKVSNTKTTLESRE